MAPGQEEGRAGGEKKGGIGVIDLDEYPLPPGPWTQSPMASVQWEFPQETGDVLWLFDQVFTSTKHGLNCR